MAGISPGGIALTAMGSVLLWSGVRGKTVSAVLKDVISGKNPATAPDANPLTASGGTPAQNAAFTGNIVSSGTAAKNQAIALPMAAAYGWTGQEWTDLVSLWNRESSWNNTARNPSSGAYGIPQSLPPSKMGTLANPPISSATAQIAWGLSYIKQSYGSPSVAWAHELSAGWY